MALSSRHQGHLLHYNPPLPTSHTAMEGAVSVLTPIEPELNHRSDEMPEESSTRSSVEPELKNLAPAKPEESTSTSASRSKWIPTQQAFDRLLTAFDSDRNEAGKKYVVTRLKLARYFERRRNVDAERAADETLDRVARKLDEGENIVNLMAYIYSVAANVFNEAIRETIRSRAIADDEDRKRVAKEQEPDVAESHLQLCFDKALAELKDGDRILILKYYREVETARIRLRREMAKELVISSNALRIQAHRIRVNLETSVKDLLRGWRDPK
jgi:DNA-directed RNA polymerase specialized sigma24 family protein